MFYSTAVLKGLSLLNKFCFLLTIISLEIYVSFRDGPNQNTYSFHLSVSIITILCCFWIKLKKCNSFWRQHSCQGYKLGSIAWNSAKQDLQIKQESMQLSWFILKAVSGLRKITRSPQACNYEILGTQLFDSLVLHCTSLLFKI